MKHKEYIKICDGAETAVLFIHGILGTPHHFDRFVALVPDSFSVYNLLLDGHGKGVKEFSKTSMKKWEAQVTAAVEQLSATHQKIYIAAHSLGTLLAIEQAMKNKQISKLFLLAVPLQIALKPKMFINSFKVYLNRIDPNDEEAVAAKNCCGIENQGNLLSYVGWLPRFLELFAKVRQVRRMINGLDVPCTVYQSANDEMVSIKGMERLKQNPCICVNELKGSGHYYYNREDWSFLLTEFEKMLD